MLWTVNKTKELDVRSIREILKTSWDPFHYLIVEKLEWIGNMNNFRMNDKHWELGPVPNWTKKITYIRHIYFAHYVLLPDYLVLWSMFTSLRNQPTQAYHCLTNLPIFKRAPDFLNPLKKSLEFKHIKCSAIRLHLLSFEMWSGHKPSKITYLS